MAKETTVVASAERGIQKELRFCECRSRLEVVPSRPLGVPGLLGPSTIAFESTDAWLQLNTSSNPLRWVGLAFSRTRPRSSGPIVSFKTVDPRVPLEFPRTRRPPPPSDNRASCVSSFSDCKRPACESSEHTLLTKSSVLSPPHVPPADPPQKHSHLIRSESPVPQSTLDDEPSGVAISPNPNPRSSMNRMTSAFPRLVLRIEGTPAALPRTTSLSSTACGSRY